MRKKSNIPKVAHKFRLYESKSKCKFVDSILMTTGKMWNMGLAAIRDHYKETGKYLEEKEVYAILKKERARNQYWQMIGAQTMQEICQRLNESYQRFFKKIQKRPPKFKQSAKFTSLVLKDAGYKLNSNNLYIAYRKEGKRRLKRFRYINSRKLNYYHKNNKDRNIFNVRLKRDSQNRYWIIFTVKQPKQTFKTRNTRGAIGVDFGLKTYMTIYNGLDFEPIDNPEFLKKDLEKLRKANKSVSRKKKGSNNRKKAVKGLLKAHRDISHRRSNWQWELAHRLCQNFKFIGVEDLNIKAMQMMWGRKISDLAHTDFMNKLQHIAKKYGTVIQEVDRYFASSKTCCKCGNKKDDLKLKDRQYECGNCGNVMDRDRNASVNIRQEAIRLYST